MPSESAEMLRSSSGPGRLNRRSPGSAGGVVPRAVRRRDGTPV